MNPRRKARKPLDFERLDDRQLLSAGVSATLSHGLLTVRATAPAQTVTVDMMSVPGRGRHAPPRGTILVEGVRQFPLARVHAVRILGAGGDLITFNESGPAQPPVQIVGAPGDVVQASGPNISISGATSQPPAVSPITLPPVTPTPVVPTPVVPAPVPVTPTPVTPPVPVTPPTTAPTGTVAQQIIALVNQQRQAAGLAPLSVDSRLMAAAQIHAQDMARLDLMEHDLPGVTFPTLQSRAAAVGYSYSWLGENIAYNYPDAASVMIGWMNSPEHRANILNPNFTQIGVAVAYDSLGQPYYCQVFGASM